MRPRKPRKEPRSAIIQLKEKFGGACVACGYDKNYAALDFHHVLPTEKSHGVNASEKGLVEADKCVLLCRNCHADHHFPHYRKNESDRDKATVIDNLTAIMNASFPWYKRAALRKSMTPEEHEQMLNYCDPERIEAQRLAMYRNFI